MSLEYLEELGSWIGRSGSIWLAVLAGVVALLGLQFRGGRLLLNASGALAFVAIIGAWLNRHELAEPFLQRILFGLFTSIAVAAAVMTIVQKNPVYSALFFAITIMGVVGLMVLSAAAFLAAATVIVYAGAIIVTFLFVIMLAQQSGLTPYDQRFWQPIPAAIAGGVLLGTLLTTINKHYEVPTSVPSILVRLEQLEAELTHAGYDADHVLPPRLLGRSFSEILLEEASRLPESSSGLKAQQVVAEAVTYWNDSWAEKPTQALTADEAASGIRRPEVTIASRGVPIFGLGTKSSKLILASKKLAAAARILSQAQKAPATVAQPRYGERQRLRLESSRLSVPTVFDSSLVQVLGRTLWGDYLLGVELAGTLLVVGAIGAIAINTRRRESHA
jgi:NADH:ubiquinone oxidoreductase subunit 6 (subunit J)